MSRLFFNLIKINMNIKQMREYYKINTKYKIDERYKKAKGETPQEKLVNMLLEEAYLSEKEQNDLINYNIEVYSMVKNIDKEKVEELDYSEVKKEVNNFRYSSLRSTQ